MTRIVLHIDSLVLRGVGRADAAAVSAALQAELQRLLAAAGAAQTITALGHPARLRTSPVRIAPGQLASTTGQAIAGGILRSLQP